MSQNPELRGAGEQPLLTPFPRANHINLLRRERSKRRGRVLTGAAVALGLVLSGGAAVAAAVPHQGRAVTVAAEDPATLALAKSALADAQAALDSAHAKADTAALQESVEDLAGAERMPAVVVQGEVRETEAKADEVVAQTAALVKADEEAAAAAAEAARVAEEQRKAAEALAAANTPGGAKATAQAMAAERYGWGGDQFGCLESLWTKESGWNYQASNPSSGAYGIPQSLPGSKMATVGADWQTNATTQIAWGLDYIQRAYGTPCAAWGHSQATNWY
ncbi:phospholipase [Microbacterium stercoris]|uniref:aggregation-promoting factor C-terminal-like domain-containing protein n=1 Tax=Microbacterium stercoris TaxID=2820289 RepID=UPI001F26735D|nr:phospholipase [Microbacterium stercoris]